jgi:hypothetical protein
MKRTSPGATLFLVLISLTIAVILVHTRRSTAESSDNKSVISGSTQERGTIVARLKDYDPTIEGFGFRNYGSKHDNEHDLDARRLIKLFGAENVCESGIAQIAFTNQLKNAAKEFKMWPTGIATARQSPACASGWNTILKADDAAIGNQAHITSLTCKS